MGRCVLRRHVWGYYVCLCPIKRTPGLNELISLFGTETNRLNGINYQRELDCFHIALFYIIVCDVISRSTILFSFALQIVPYPVELVWSLWESYIRIVSTYNTNLDSIKCNNREQNNWVPRSPGIINCELLQNLCQRISRIQHFCSICSIRLRTLLIRKNKLCSKQLEKV